jgi:pimeloyl-ACP methyl ester carboxylesterase
MRRCLTALAMAISFMAMTNSQTVRNDMTTTLILDRGDGTLAYDVTGTGPLVICAPGMGDIRQTFRYLVPALVEAGYRVATFDLRGHGESGTTFARYDDPAEASDIVALAQLLGGSATVIGNSMGSAAGIIAAAQHPELVTSLVLVGPFTRNPKGSAFAMSLMKLVTSAPIAAPVWKMYLPSLYAGRKPADFTDFTGRANAAMRRKGYAATFSKTTHTVNHDPSAAVIATVKTPALIVMGELDPDFPDTAAEATWISEQLTNSEILMVPEAGHYPQSQRPDIVNPAVVAFLARVAPVA